MIIFPGLITDIGSAIILWIAYSLVLGRGWCSWGCFWGGWDDGFSRIRQKSFIKKINRNLTYLPFAVLLATVLTSALTLSAQYFWWICPFKTVSEFLEISTAKIAVQTAIDTGKYVKCGRCIDACPRKAVSYHIKGTEIGVNTELKRNLFLYSALFLSLFMSGSAIIPAVYRILLFISTGSFVS